MSLLNPNMIVPCSCSWSTSVSLDTDCESAWAKTVAKDVQCESAWERSIPIDKQCNSAWSKALTVDLLCESAWEIALSIDVLCESGWDIATPIDKQCESAWSRVLFVDVNCQSAWSRGLFVDVLCESGWNIGNVIDVICQAEYDEDKVIIGPTPQGCESAWIATGSVIMIKNDVTLIRVSDGQKINILSASVSTDIDSWTWNFSAICNTRVDAEYARPTGQGPIEVRLNINEYYWHFWVEQISENYEYGNGTYNIQGRSPSCSLAKPYAILQTKTWDSTSYPLGINAQQITGYELDAEGWFQDWNVVDWNIPGDIYSVKDKTIIDICSEVVKASGGVMMTKGGFPLSETYEKRMIFNYRYPTSPKNFDSITPDEYILAGVIFGQDIEWSPKSKYDNVFVTGREAGYITHVKRDGEPWTIPAPSVSLTLLTTAQVNAEKGRNILDQDGYNKTNYTMRLPLPLQSSAVRPKLLFPTDIVQVEDLFEVWRGLITSVSIEASLPQVTQIVSVERSWT